MNRTNCPALFATDQAFQRGTPGACDTSFPGFLVFCLMATFLSLITALKQYSNWKKRGKHQSRIPRGPITQLTYSLLQAGLLIPLIAVNLANFQNGVSFSLYTINFLPFAYAYTVGLLRLVSLGEKIIPKSRRPVGESAASLAEFDSFGKMMFATQSMSIVVTSAMLIILSPILTDYENVISRIGWGTKSLFLFVCQCGYWYQFERCIKAIRQVQLGLPVSQNLTGDSEHVSSSDAKKGTLKDFQEAIMRMRRHQLSHVSASPAVLIFFLLAIGAIPANIWIIYTPVISQALGGMYFEFRAKANPQQNTVTTHNLTSQVRSVPDRPVATNDARLVGPSLASTNTDV